MRIAAIESQHGRPDAKGRIPHKVSIHEEWPTLQDAVKHAEERIRKRGLTWTTRQLGPEMVEIDVHDPPIETLVGFFDADAIENKTGAPIMDFLRFYIEKEGMMESIFAETPGFKEQLEALGINRVETGQARYKWSNDYTEIERRVKARRVIRGVIPESDGRAKGVRIWDAVLGFKGDPRPVMVWDGDDGPVEFERIGLGMSGGAVQRVPRGMLFISWRRLREVVTKLGHECLVGDPL